MARHLSRAGETSASDDGPGQQADRDPDRAEEVGQGDPTSSHATSLHYGPYTGSRLPPDPAFRTFALSDVCMNAMI